MSARPPDTLDAERPFPGLESFREDFRSFFFGRALEVDDLFRLVRRGVATVLFGRSGLGKTSLLQAGLFPLLREHALFPIPVRFLYTATGAGIAAQIRAAIVDQLREHGVDGPLPDESRTLWEYLHGARLWDGKNQLLTPVLVFDQFEEIFTLGQDDAHSLELLETLEELIENRMPTSVRARMEAGAELPFDHHKAPYRILLCLREDFLPQLEGLSQRIPSLLHQRMRLTPMSGAQALEAVLAPAGGLIEKESARRIVAFVAARRLEDPSLPPQSTPGTRLESKEIEPALLALVCFELNELRLSRGKAQIDRELFEFEQQEILSAFYERCFQGLGEQVRVFVEDRLLTSSGYRGTLAVDDALQIPGVSTEAIDLLVNRRLLRVERRLGTPHLELTHDVLTGVVRDSRAKRHAALAQQLERGLRPRRMRRRVGAIVGLHATVALIAAAIAFDAKREREKRAALTARVLDAELSSLDRILEDFEPFPTEILPLLREKLEDPATDPKRRLRASLALLKNDRSQVEFLKQQLLTASVDEFTVIRESLLDERTELVEDLWREIEEGDPGSTRSLRAAMALAAYAPPTDVASTLRWEQSSVLIATGLVNEVRRNGEQLRALGAALAPVSGLLRPTLLQLLASPILGVRLGAAQVISTFAVERPEYLNELIQGEDGEQQLTALMPLLEGAAARLAEDRGLEREDGRSTRALPSVEFGNATDRATAASSPVSSEALLKTFPDKVVEAMQEQLVSSYAGDPVPMATWIPLFHAAGGTLTADHAVCQSMPMEEFIRIAGELRGFGYRPVRVRPFESGAGSRVAAVWRRDAQPWVMAHGLGANQMLRRDKAWQSVGFVAVDVAGYLAKEPEGKPLEQYVAVWAPPERRGFSPQRTRMILGETSGLDEVTQQLKSSGLEVSTRQIFLDSFGDAHFSEIWTSAREGKRTSASYATPKYFAELVGSSDKTILDVGVVLSPIVPDVEAFWEARIEARQKALDRKPDDLDAMLALAFAAYQLGRTERSIQGLTVLLARPELPPKKLERIHYWRVLHYASAGRFEEAHADLEAYRALEEVTEDDALYLRAILAANQKDRAALEAVLSEIESAVKRAKPEYSYNFACAFGMAAAKATDPADRARYQARGMAFLRSAVDSGAFHDAVHMQTDVDIASLREMPGCSTLVEAVRPGFTVVWRDRPVRSETDTVVGATTTVAHLRDAQRQLEAGRSPVAVSTACCCAKDEVLSRSLWSRLSAPDRTKIHSSKAALAMSVLSELGRDQEAIELALDGKLDLDWLQREAGAARSTEDFRQRVALERTKREKLGWPPSMASTRKWWSSFEAANVNCLACVGDLATKLERLNASIDDFFLAYVYSNTDSIEANLDYMRFVRLRKQHEAARKQGERIDRYAAFLQAHPPTEVYARELRALSREAAEKRLRQRLSELGLDEAAPEARSWWESLIREDRERIHLLVQVADTLAARSDSSSGAASPAPAGPRAQTGAARPEMTAEGLFDAAALSRVDDIEASLLYGSFRRKAAEYLTSLGKPLPGESALLRFARARITGEIPGALARSASERRRTAEALEQGLSSMEALLVEYPGEIAPEVVFHVVRENADLYRDAIELGLPLDLVDLGKRLCKAAKDLVNEKEISFYLLGQLPKPDSLAEPLRENRTRAIARVTEEYGDRMVGLWEELGVPIDAPEEPYNQASTEADVEALFTRLSAALFVGDSSTAGTILKNLRPDAERLRHALLPGVSEAVVRRLIASQDLWDTIPEILLRNKSGRVAVRRHVTDDLLKGDRGALSELPPWLGEQARTIFRPGVPVSGVTLADLATGNRETIRFGFVFWDGSQWTVLSAVPAR